MGQVGGGGGGGGDGDGRRGTGYRAGRYLFGGGEGDLVGSRRHVGRSEGGYGRVPVCSRVWGWTDGRRRW